ncbi:hypothetical protein Tco_0749864 [Tanacetum coccineum]|uniref:Uncharacterized protein n=1 Tax=Tanacetum coccineum TaxID=301880 RepID=A0ABQ4YZM3_9ASTR
MNQNHFHRTMLQEVAVDHDSETFKPTARSPTSSIIVTSPFDSSLAPLYSSYSSSLFSSHFSPYAFVASHIILVMIVGKAILCVVIIIGFGLRLDELLRSHVEREEQASQSEQQESVFENDGVSQAVQSTKGALSSPPAIPQLSGTMSFYFSYKWPAY